jgi:hypothetical protein
VADEQKIKIVNNTQLLLTVH